MFLTKSDFLLYLECPLHLWAKANNQLASKKFSVYDQLVARQGYRVEAFAKKFLEQQLINKYPEGSSLDFQYQLRDGSYEAKIDAIIHNASTDSYDLYEIKSGTKIDRQHKYDITFQHLIAKASLVVNKTYLVHVNGEYVKDGEIELESFFTVEEMDSVIAKLEDEVFAERAKALEVLEGKEAPLEYHCYKPKDCPCRDLCHPNLGDYPIYDLSWWKVGQYETLLANGYHDLIELDENEDLNPRQRLQLQSIKENRAIIDVKAIKQELGNLVFPLYFLDYETFNPAIPVFDGYKPYQQIVFQYSLHVLESNEAREFKHYEFLMTEKREPSKELVESLLGVIGDQGSVIVWNKNFECKRNEELAELQPLYAKQLLKINERVFDLMDIFKDGLYSDYRFHGSASIKKVLPVLVPALSYEGMEIGEGATAMTKWWEMVDGELSEEKKREIRENLLKYCELDTWAMVEIWRELQIIF